MGLVDSHAHLTAPELRGQVADVLARCSQAGVETVITVGTDLADSKAALSLAVQYPGRVCAAVGVHPHEAGKVGNAELVAVSRLWERPEVVAVGEIGLDYHYDFCEREKQQWVFARQLELASDLDRPIIIHAREALDDVISLLLEKGYKQRRVVFHCFSGTRESASRIAEHGWRVSFTGMITFRQSSELKQIAKSCPSYKLMIETDSPYLSPEPVRNRRPNEPALLIHTVRFLADLRGVPYDTLVKQTAHNTRMFFDIPGPPGSTNEQLGNGLTDK
ncbi:MAG: TatD family hydrolase [Phycisphaerae bacterium]